MRLSEAQGKTREELSKIRKELGNNPPLDTLLKLAGYYLANIHAAKNGEEQNENAAKAAAALQLFMISEG
jgi:hypothetical protein